MFRLEFLLLIFCCAPIQVFSQTTKVSFDGDNNLIVVKATINGRGPFRLLVDTGSSHHLLSREVADQLGLKTTGNVQVDAGGQTLANAGTTQITELKIGEATLRNQPAFVAPLPETYPFQGLLGAELFKQFIVTIDFAHSLLILTPPAEFKDRKEGARVRIKLLHGLIPEAEAQVEGHAGRFKIDTGYNGSLALFAEFVARHKAFLNDDSYPSSTAAGGQTLAGEVGSTRVVRIKLLKLFPLKSSSRAQSIPLILPDVPAALFTEKGGSNSAYAGAIGTVVLQNFRVTFNYPQRLMILASR